MNRLHVVIILSSFFLFYDAKAQYYEEPDTVVIEKKNTIGLYISPAVNFMMNSFTHNPRVGIQYKRWLTDYKRLRLSLVHDKIKFSEADETFDPDNFISATDSSFTVATEKRNQRKTTLRAGMEWTNYQEKVDGFFGIDLIAGYKLDEYEMKMETYRWKNYTYPNGDTIQDFRQDQRLTRWPYAYKYEFIELGISPIIGWRFDIKSNFEFVVSASPEVSIAIPVASEWLGELPMPIGSPPDTEIEFRLRLLEMVLSYRF